MVAAVAASVTVLLFVPALVTHSLLTALPYVVLAAAALSAQNPPIDAARLDIMPPWLWGRAEGVRTFVRTGAQALAPLLFGAVSDYVFGGGTAGLKWTFVVMLLPLAASAVFLFSAARRYPSDVATAAVTAHPSGPPAPGGGPEGPVGPRGPVPQVRPRGPVGPVGPVGPAGSMGSPGGAGRVGPLGPTGPIASSGPGGPAT